ncbi:apolipoprotein A-II-like [Ambystoma mexicanum]|uniref:apolipoprotein A-II-like n=1 Tax=Ambystoma mexicanum TaxID=8296 RepID=UPI0037E74588
MKVFVVAFLLLAVSSLEAAVVKRQAQSPIPGFDELSKMFSTWADVITTGTQDIIKQVQMEELQSQAQGFVDKSKTHMEPVKAEVNKFLEQIMKMLNNPGQ